MIIFPEGLVNIRKLKAFQWTMVADAISAAIVSGSEIGPKLSGLSPCYNVRSRGWYIPVRGPGELFAGSADTS